MKKIPLANKHNPKAKGLLMVQGQENPKLDKKTSTVTGTTNEKEPQYCAHICPLLSNSNLSKCYSLLAKTSLDHHHQLRVHTTLNHS